MPDNNRSSDQPTPTLEAQLSDLRSDVKALSSTLTNMMQNELSGLAKEARAKIRDVKGHAQDAGDWAEQHANEALHSTRDAIARNPLTAAAIALGAGFLIGLLARRR